MTLYHLLILRASKNTLLLEDGEETYSILHGENKCFDIYYCLEASNSATTLFDSLIGISS